MKPINKLIFDIKPYNNKRMIAKRHDSINSVLQDSIYTALYMDLQFMFNDSIKNWRLYETP